MKPDRGNPPLTRLPNLHCLNIRRPNLHGRPFRPTKSPLRGPPNRLTHRRALPPRESKNLKNSLPTKKATAQRINPASQRQPKPSRRPGPSHHRTHTGTRWPTGIGMTRKGARGRPARNLVRNRPARAAGPLSAAARGAVMKDADGAVAIDRNARNVLRQLQPRRRRRHPGRRDKRHRASRTISDWVSKANSRDFTRPQNNLPPKK